ncbi:hypothetical protein NHX12_002603 [Muraenolepis orangiensis]|uniref:Myb/SANT-like DNA-binding domain-containing protein n=1 Tax=Muraenolepis orangiensis TaxID=630683 RepID=A0A9Q0DUT2_9TELE|nr:hypothetical protein NHX12_002603 [Muraenolepis orangiensis]
MEGNTNPLSHLPENSYKMTEDDVKRLIEFRASNESLFTGKRNSAKIAWNTILKGLGLQGKLTADQIAKKWDNLRTKYKDLKQPFQGTESSGGSQDSWPWFHIMDDAMQGRLYNSNLVLSPAPHAHPPTNQHLATGASASRHSSRNQDNADILEFLIKTEMEDSGAGDAHPRQAPPSEGVPMGWRRMSECTYKMTEQETESMIKLRSANEALFTGRKHSAKPAWRAILYELGLQGKVTTEQLAKKWDNLKRRYKELKFPARGVESSPGSWPWFYRMSDAMEGRFATAAPVLTPIVEEGDEDCEPSSPPPPSRKRRLTELTYKLTEEDTRRLIELRAANESLFTGRRNTAKPAWRGIVKEMGLTGKITPDQVAKKWDNLKTKFKDLKFPPRGVEAQLSPSPWPWYHLMSEALEGRLLGRAPRVAPLWTSEEDVFGASSPAADRHSISELDDGPDVMEGVAMEAATSEADGNITYIDASGEECSTPSDLSYKTKAAWKAILKELGLLGKVSTYQMSKKWDNLKRRYKDLKYPPVGMEAVVDGSGSWPWFHLMNEAMEGRLGDSAPLLTPITHEEQQHPDPGPRARPPHQPLGPDYSQDPYPDVTGGHDCGPGGDSCDRVMQERLGGLEREWEMVERERLSVERDRLVVETDRAVLDRDRAGLERDRVAVERDRASVQAERQWLERERAMIDQERASLDRERELVDNQRALILSSVGHTGHLNPLGM